MNTISIPTSTTPNIISMATNMFHGFSSIIILVISLVFGFWVLSIIVRIATTVLQNRRYARNIASSIAFLRTRGYEIMAGVPISPEVIKEAEEVRFLRREGYEVTIPTAAKVARK
jgi:hypothetical protein